MAVLGSRKEPLQQNKEALQQNVEAPQENAEAPQDFLEALELFYSMSYEMTQFSHVINNIEKTHLSQIGR